MNLCAPTVTWRRPAVKIANSTDLLRTAATFSIATASVGIAVPVVIDTGTANDGYRAPQTRLMLRPATGRG